MRWLFLRNNSSLASPVALLEVKGEMLGSGNTGFTIWMALEGAGMAEDGFMT
jgi:hypothetical protein